MVSKKEVLAFLKDKSSEAGLIDRLKIRYRPVVCPFPELLDLVKEGSKVGDIGCGSGQFALMIAAFCKPSEIVGIEITERLVENAKKLFSTANVNVPFHFDKYDGVTFPAAISGCDQFFMVDVLHHIPRLNHEAFFRSLYQVMKPGSQLILKDIDAGSPLVLFNKVHDLVFSGEIGCEINIHRAEELAKTTGFRIVKKFTKVTLVYPHYFLVLEKSQQ